MVEKEPLEQFNHRVPQSIKQKFKEICQREGKEMNDALVEMLKKFTEEHGGDGNPQPKLDGFLQQDGYLIAPGFFRNREAWEKYISSFKTKNDYRKFDDQLSLIWNLNRNFFRQSGGDLF